MKSLKMKILTVAVLIAFAVSMLIVGIYAAETQKITMQGTVSFEIADKTLYVKDVRLKNDNTLTGQGTTLNNFKPGFINGEYKIDLGSISSDTSFTLYFDIVNTTSTFYSASENSTVSNASVSASGIIRGDAVDPTTINSDTPISGTVQLDITISNPQNVNLNNITILLNEYQEPEVEHNDLLDFTFDGNTLTSYTGSDSEVIIPSSYSIRPSDNAFVAGNDYSVTAIGGFALANCNSTSITIPSSITSLGTGAFANCKNLTELNYNATSISNLSANNYVFYNAGQNTNGITINFANGVSTIPSYLFASTNSTATSPKITQVNMPSTVTTINSYAFAYNTNLKSVTLPSNLTSIGSNAFYGCSGLTNITLPSSLISIEFRAFEGCSGLTEVDLSNCTSLTSIGSFAFSSCSGLTSITLSSSLTSIGGSAFFGCRALTEINYNAVSVADLSEERNYVFAYAGQDGAGITVNFGEGVENIPAYLFYPYSNTSYAPNIKAVNFSSTITSIGTYAFYNCSGIETLECKGTVKQWVSIEFGSSWIIGASYKFIVNGEELINLVAPEGVVSINDYAFSNCSSLTSIDLDNCTSLTSIGRHAFRDCSGLTSITLPSSLTSIEYMAFYGCSGLTSMDLSNCTSLTSIGNSAFYNCSGLTEVDLSSCTSLTSIVDSAFRGCSGLTSIIFPSSLTSIGTYAFRGCSGLANIDFSHCTSLTSIKYDAFQDCSGLTNITLPSSLISIEFRAFEGCSGLTEVDLSNCTNLTSIGSNTFYGCNNLTSIIFPNTTGWYRATSSTATSGINMTMSNPTQNATWLTDTYVSSYFKRNA